MSLPLTHAGLSAPGISAALDLRFALDKSLTAYRGPTPSFSRASTGSYFDGSGVLRYAALNLLTYSEDFTNAVWTKTNATITANAILSPDGKLTADKISEDSASAKHRAYVMPSVTVGTIYTFSVYAKSAERNWLAMNYADTNANMYAYFNLQNGTIGSVDASMTASITSVGNGWYRCSVTKTLSAAGPNFDVGPTTGDGVFSYAGTIGSGIYIWGAQLEASSTVGTYCPTTNAANSAPRFDHAYDGTSWISRGLLVEEQRTNVVLNSANFTSGWATPNVAMATSSGTSPDGTNTAVKLYPTASTIQTRIYRSSTQSCISVFAKAAEKQFVYFYDKVGVNACWFNLSTGAIGTNATGLSASILNCGNGWFRCSLATSSGTFSFFQIGVSDANGSTSSTASGTNGVLIWGAQEEAGSFPTSYIPTTSASATRSADVCQITGADFSGFWNGTEGSIAFEADVIGNNSGNGNQFVFGASLSSSAANNQIALIRNLNNLGGDYGLFVKNAGTLQVATSRAAESWAIGSTVKAASAYKLNDFADVLNGGAAITDTSGTIPTVDQLSIGNSFNGGGPLNGHIARLRYFNKRLTDKQLEDLCKPEDQLKLDLKFSENLSLTPVVGPTPSFSRASMGSYFGSDGLLKYLNINLLKYSEDFSNAVWGGVSLGVSANAITAPDGTATADLLTEDSSNGFHQRSQTYTTSTATYTFSCFVKWKTGTTRNIALLPVSASAAGTNKGIIFDSNGAYVAVAGDVGPTPTYTSESVGNGWFRFSVTTSASGGVSSAGTTIRFHSGTTNSYAGDGSSGVYVWGAQLETSPFAGQYSKTEASSNSNARFDHAYENGSWVSKGLLIEEQRTNVCLWSEDFNNAAWTDVAGRTIYLDAATAPDGNTTADRIILTGSGYSLQKRAYTTTGNHTFSVWLRASSPTVVCIRISNDAGSQSYVVNCNVTTSWQRFSVTGNWSSNPVNFYAGFDQRSVVGGPGASADFFTWGAQLELGSFPTSYIPTTTTSVVRSADVCQITGTDFSGMWNQSEGSAVCEADTFSSTSSVSRYYYFDDTTTGNQVIGSVTLDATGSTGGDYVYNYAYNGAIQAAFAVQPARPFAKSAFAWRVNDFASSTNGGSVSIDSSGAIPSGISRVALGANSSSGQILNGHISRLRYYAIRLPNRLLIAKSQ